MGFQKFRRQLPKIYRIYAIALSLMVVAVFQTNWESTSTQSDLFYGAYRTPTNAAESLDLSWSGDIKGKPCLPYIFYDKPVKTASTTVTKAIRNYVLTTGDKVIYCGKREECDLAIESVCLGIRPPTHFVQHVSINSTIVDCLHDIGYYHVTSIRDPKERIISAFKYNRATPGADYGISPNASFDEFLQHFPRCSLFQYYDRLSPHCGSDKKAIEERAERIANRMDEVIDITEKPVSDLHGRISQYLGMLNVVEANSSNATHAVVPDEVVASEYVLYNKLRRRQELLARHSERRLCNFRQFVKGKPHLNQTFQR